MFVLRLQGYVFVSYADSFYGQFAVEDGYDHVFVSGLEASVYYQEVARLDSCAYHGIAASPNEKGCGGVFDEIPVEVEFVLFIVGGG